MGTRALVGFIHDQSGQPELISTYNHYDGYPENLGVALDKFYSTPEEALEVASTGYISYIDPETGDIFSKNKESANKTKLSNDFKEAMYQVAEIADSYGADYIYIYNVEKLVWQYVKLYGVTQAVDDLMSNLEDYDGGIFSPSLDETYHVDDTKEVVTNDELDELFAHQMKYKAGIIK